MSHVDLSVNTVIELIAQGFFNGDIQLAGLAILAVTLVLVAVIMASIKAPMEYSLLPAMVLTALFATMGIINTTLSFLIIILAAVPLASRARALVGDR